MFSDNLSSIDGISIFPIISMIIFFLFFIAVVIWVVKKDKKYITELENIPLDNRDEFIKNTEMKNEEE